VTLSDFDYDLPANLIAQRPVVPRDAARLMVIHRQSGEIEHWKFRDITSYLHAGDALALNRTQVLPARLLGRKTGTGGQVEVVLIREVASGLWEALLRPARRLGIGSKMELEDGMVHAEAAAGPDPDRKYIRFPEGLNVIEMLQRVGRLPLPPYIQRSDDTQDRSGYQTVYADAPGAVAAPTAGLHFTDQLLQRISDQGVSVIPILLHVGPGTFQPVRVERIEDHRMETEYYHIDADAARRLTDVRRTGRLIAVGTTTVRTLETAAIEQPSDREIVIESGEGWTSKFIFPPYRFQMVDGLLTNFHLPRSTLLMLVCAFAGRELTLEAYAQAVRQGYRFYSYGDAMLIV